MKLLLVEDDALLRRQLKVGLGRSGHAIAAVANAQEALIQLAREHFDLALIDLGLPGMSGMALIRQLRAGGQLLPILILSARCHWRDKVEGLAAGADDYLVKPFEFDELDTRLNVLLSRSCGFTVPTLSSGPLVLNLNRQQAWLDCRPLDLSLCEFRLLEYLMRHHQHVLSKDHLLSLYQNGRECNPHVIEVLVDRLQRKLEGVPGFQPIDTVRGQGYRFTERCT
jgi:two-component system response regulator PhoP